ncbi:MAG: hypothetical protein ABIN48_07760 [Ginsengibacter sp.]
MENIYSAYTKKVNNETLYFVKKYTSFTDIEGSPQILSEFGMHSSFFKACKIAQIFNKEIINELAIQVHLNPVTDAAKVISFNKSKHASRSFLRNTQHFLSKLRLAGI